jgi:hypothetical protein
LADLIKAYIADVDDGASLSARGSIVCERVGRKIGMRGLGSGIETTSRTSSAAASAAAAISSSSSIAASAIASTASSKSTTTAISAAAAAAVASAEASTAAETTTKTTTSRRGASESVFTDFESAALPFVAIELLDRVPSIIRIVEDYDSGAFGAAFGSLMDICTNNISRLG